MRRFEGDRHGPAAENPGVRGLREDRRRLGAPADVPEMRRDTVLRRLAQSPCDETRQGHRPPGDSLGGAGRAMVVLLSPRFPPRVLTPRDLANGMAARRPRQERINAGLLAFLKA